MDTRWLTYDELAAALGITPDSARRLVSRNKNWPRRPGNDGRVRIGVPAERLPDTPAVGAGNRPDVSPDVIAPVPPPVVTPDTGNDVTPVVRILTQHIERLEKEILDLRGERDAERARVAELAEKAAQLNVANAMVDVGRKRIEDLSADRDAKAAQIENLNTLIGLERKRAEADRNDLRADLGRLRSELDRAAERVALVAPVPAAPAAQPQGWWPFRRRA